MKPEIQIRVATIVDLPILLEFEQGIIAAERPFDPTLKNGHINYYDIRSLIESSDSDVLVAVDNERIIGSAYISIRPAKDYLKHDQYGYLGFMYVLPKYRGQGVNFHIIEKLKQWARSKEISELRLDVYYENDPALKAYQKAGFSNHLINMRMKI